VAVIETGRLLRPKEACQRLGISYGTLHKWIKEGKIRAVRSESGYHLIPEEEVERVRKYGPRVADWAVEAAERYGPEIAGWATGADLYSDMIIKMLKELRDMIDHILRSEEERRRHPQHRKHR